MSEVQPQPGDKVRVTYETVVRNDGSYIGRSMLNTPEALNDTVEVLERADDPSRDEVGTVAELDGDIWVKRAENSWWPIAQEFRHRSNNKMHGRVVTGAVPGTPAAQARRASIRVPEDWMDDILSLPSYVHGDLAIDELFRLIESWLPAAKVEPLVVQYGDPEPDRHTFFTQATGGQVGWVRDNLWHVPDQDEPIAWDQLARWRFPMTEMRES